METSKLFKDVPSSWATQSQGFADVASFLAVMYGDWSFVLISPTLFYFNLEKQENKTTPEQAGFNLLWEKKKKRKKPECLGKHVKLHFQLSSFSLQCTCTSKSLSLLSGCCTATPFVGAKGSKRFKSVFKQTLPQSWWMVYSSQFKTFGRKNKKRINTPPKHLQNHNKLPKKLLSPSNHVCLVIHVWRHRCSPSCFSSRTHISIN